MVALSENPTSDPSSLVNSIYQKIALLFQYNGYSVYGRQSRDVRKRLERIVWTAQRKGGRAKRMPTLSDLAYAVCASIETEFARNAADISRQMPDVAPLVTAMVELVQSTALGEGFSEKRENYRRSRPAHV